MLEQGLGHNPTLLISTLLPLSLNKSFLLNRILLTSTSEVYGDPLIHPQPESYWGNVNPIGSFIHFIITCVSFSLSYKVDAMIIGVRSCYDEGKRVAETLMFDYHRQHGIGQLYFPEPLACSLIKIFSLSFVPYLVFVCSL